MADQNADRMRTGAGDQPSWDPEGYRYNQQNQSTQQQRDNVDMWARQRQSNMPTTWVYEEYYWWAEPGPYTGRGPRGYIRSDEDIYKDVCSRLAQNGELDASEIEVSVKDHEVTLNGNVDDRRSKRLAEDIADSVMGVEDIHNDLHVRRQRQMFARPGQTYQEQPQGLKDGQQVVGPMGHKAGKVKEIHAHDFVLGRTAGPDVHVPFSAIQDITGNQVKLNIPADQIDRQNWTHI